MLYSSKEMDVSNLSQGGSSNEMVVAKNYYDNSINNIITPAEIAQQSSTIQQILAGIIELDIELEATPLDIQPFGIMSKIEYNNIIVYKRAYDTYMQHKIVIEKRLDILENSGYPLATKKLYKIVKIIFASHCDYDDPDEIIRCMVNELKEDLSSYNFLSNDDIQYIPSIIFFVFANCQIFVKPLI